jgi:arabinogalactan endo-1,4-beta-galactosidase
VPAPRERRPCLARAARALAALLCVIAAAAPPRAAAAVFLAGADLSYQPTLRAAGASYRDGQAPRPLPELLRDHGVNLARLRLWHRPAGAEGSLAATLALARECQAAGLRVMLDLHYSDTWADPAHQAPPAAWRDLPAAALADSVRAWTAAALGVFRDAGVPLTLVQLGNEIDAGLLWETGRLPAVGDAADTPRQREAFTTLLRAASEGARAALPPRCGTQLVVHLARGGDIAACRRVLDLLRQGGVDFDVIAVSYYPWWHGDLAALAANLRALHERYGAPVLVAETAYPWTLAWADATHNLVGTSAQLLAGYPATPAGQAAFAARLRALVTETPGGLGMVWWAPDAIPAPGGPGSPVENLALFDFTGAALPALDALGRAASADSATASPAATAR